ncbi:MAG: substrate-binding periplasmic protein [Thermodesulfobacteriota bacterium]
MKGIMSLLLAAVFCFSMQVSAQEQEITMGYKDDSKKPLIGDPGDDSGLYQELFSKAAAMIGYKLRIERLPKKRLYAKFEKGELDFYPGASFSEERAMYMCFLDNGLKTKEVLITRSDLPEIRDISTVAGKLLADLGGSKSDFNKKYNKIQVVEVASLELERAIEMLKAGRADFYIADIEEVDYYQKSKGLKSYEDIGMKVHYQAFGDFIPMYMGFSMNSKLFKAKANPRYDSSKPLDYENTPKTVAEDCVAHQFQAALLKLKASGETQKLYDAYFK